MFHKKIYGLSKTEKCPFCSRTSIVTNKEGVPVCQNHKNSTLNLKCICGEWLELRKSKWGVFFSCMNCGAISMHKALEMNSGASEEDKNIENINNPENMGSLNNSNNPKNPNNSKKPNPENDFILPSESYEKSSDERKSSAQKPMNKAKKEITVRSDELDFL